MIAIIDYDAGNIKSVEKALLHLGEEVMITRDREQILNSDKVIDKKEIINSFIKLIKIFSRIQNLKNQSITFFAIFSHQSI